MTPQLHVKLFIVDLKQMDCQIFLQQRCIYLGSEESCNSESDHGEPRASYRSARKKQFYRGEKEVGMAIVNNSVWLFIESLPGKKRVLLPLFGLALQGLGAPHLGLLTLI